MLKFQLIFKERNFLKVLNFSNFERYRKTAVTVVGFETRCGVLNMVDRLRVRRPRYRFPGRDEKLLPARLSLQSTLPPIRLSPGLNRQRH